ncbi:MAG: hypothetical protein IT342_08830 [Candidatus Melainabacteria bacterium]|nr:hypothetical protein [Candidatus Melainabacteria bacterium]
MRLSVFQVAILRKQRKPGPEGQPPPQTEPLLKLKPSQVKLERLQPTLEKSLPKAKINPPLPKTNQTKATPPLPLRRK